MKNSGLIEQLPLLLAGKTGWPWMAESQPMSPLMPDGKPWPKISIVTPSYNQGQFLEETIRSVLLQNYPNLEYIIIDGGSSDNSVEIIKKYEQWLTYWVSEPDNGQSDAINKGLKKVTGEVFNWLCSDDYLEPYALLDIGQKLNQNTTENAYCGRCRYWNEVLNECYESPGSYIAKTIEQTLFQHHIDQPVTFYKVSAIKTMGPLLNDLHYQMCAEYWLRYLLQYGQNEIARSDKIIANYRIHETSKTATYKNSKFKKERYVLLINLAKLIGMNSIDISRLKEKFFLDEIIDIRWDYRTFLHERILKAYYFRLLFYFSYDSKDFRKAFYYFMKYIIYGGPGFFEYFIELLNKVIRKMQETNRKRVSVG
ncbi:MAG: glycosyltransferase [Smithella sp.]|nr:glycosyltransferase [Smithella sp.]